MGGINQQDSYILAQMIEDEYRGNKMPPIETKSQIMAKLQENRNKLEKLIARLSSQEMERPGVCGNWSIKDILAHLDDWQQRNIEWIDAAYQGQYLEIPAPGLSWRAEDVDRLNNQILPGALS